MSQTIDGNDYQATHFVIYAKREPIGATRLRWFRDLAKIERTGFRPAYRNIRILKRTGDVTSVTRFVENSSTSSDTWQRPVRRG